MEMTVYHTSDLTIHNPDVLHSRKYLDFGSGFYVTTLKEQAEKYSAKIRIRGKQPVLNIYELKIDVSTINYKRFDNYNEEWLDYVAACRDGRNVERFDIIEGGIANDKVFDTVDLYFSGRMSKDDALRKLAFTKPNWQICITSQAVLDNSLKFINSENLM
ncbi:MAG: DUF3990 domain-containing protein [Bacteroidia bacterium]|nr:DUF3990 domain-containing protein [Bacteroidia bacterium]